MTFWEHLTAEYLGISVLDVGKLGLIEYLTYRRDAFIARFSMTEAGQEYLDNAWRCEQTEPDREALRRQFSERRD